jgi:hypothetical protein
MKPKNKNLKCHRALEKGLIKDGSYGTEKY